MKCERCPAFRKTSYEYDEYDCCVGVLEDDLYEDSKGNYGCKLHWKTIQKLIQKEAESFSISIADGQRMINPEKYDELLRKARQISYINQAKHCIGLDKRKPYKRNGKLYFRPYRNYFNTNYDNEIWADLRWLGFADCDCEYWESEEKKKSVFFSLNEDGRKWLAEQLGIFKIWEESD